jgi:T-complex protein 11
MHNISLRADVSYDHDYDSCRHTEARAPVIFKRRLPIMFETPRELLEALVPDWYHPQIVENLDAALLMQQVEKGVLDIVRPSQWIADLLKSHCAPMRDE